MPDLQLLTCYHLKSKMDQDGKAPKTFVSTLRFALKPQPNQQKENGLGNIKRKLVGNKLRFSSASGKALKKM